MISSLTIAYGQNHNTLNIQLYPIQILKIDKPRNLTFSYNTNDRADKNIYSTSGYNINIYIKDSMNNSESDNSKPTNNTSKVNTDSNNIPTQIIYSIEVI